MISLSIKKAQTFPLIFSAGVWKDLEVNKLEIAHAVTRELPHTYSHFLHLFSRR